MLKCTAPIPRPLRFAEAPSVQSAWEAFRTWDAFSASQVSRTKVRQVGATSPDSATFRYFVRPLVSGAARSGTRECDGLLRVQVSVPCCTPYGVLSGSEATWAPAVSTVDGMRKLERRRLVVGSARAFVFRDRGNYPFTELRTPMRRHMEAKRVRRVQPRGYGSLTAACAAARILMLQVRDTRK